MTDANTPSPGTTLLPAWLSWLTRQLWTFVRGKLTVILCAALFIVATTDVEQTSAMQTVTRIATFALSAFTGIKLDEPPSPVRQQSDMPYAMPETLPVGPYRKPVTVDKTILFTGTETELQKRLKTLHNKYNRREDYWQWRVRQLQNENAQINYQCNIDKERDDY